MSGLVCEVCCEVPCACELNNREAELMADKAALFDEMRLTLLTAGMSAALDAKHFAENLKLKRPYPIPHDLVIRQNIERYNEMKDLVERANKIAEANK